MKNTSRTGAEASLQGIRWGVIGFGALTGLVASFAAFLILGIAGAVSTDQTGPLLVVVYASQLLAGFVAGRFAMKDGALHGGLAGLGLFAVAAALAVAGGTDPAIATMFFSLVIASVIGSAGGLLADWRRLER